jgi:DNA-binding MarR family transcriptional regulator
MPSSRDADLLDQLVQNAFTVAAVLTRIAADHDVSLTQLRVLGILHDRRPRMAALADHLGLDKSTMSGLVARAEKRGLVERQPDPTDSRASIVSMTPAGIELADRVRAEVHAELAPLVDPLAPAERATLRGLLATVGGERG